MLPLALLLVATAHSHFADAAVGEAGTCPAGVNTSCASDGSATCCPILMSLSGYGCCKLAGGVCCPVSPTVQSCCPPSTRCVATGGYSAVCEPIGGGPNVSASQVCTPGARFPPSTSQSSVIIIGDSVSEGYAPPLAAAVSAALFVQHSPWSTGGGADDVGNGVNCEEEFLRTAMWQPASWRGITFNFGLHNLNQAPASERQYEALLTNFTARLLKTDSRLLYISTTPFMPDHYYGNVVVEDLNAAAQRVMSAAGVRYVDLYSHITDRCGVNYTACDICDNESSIWPAGAPAGAHCGYHYTAAGYAYISAFLAPIFESFFG